MDDLNEVLQTPITAACEAAVVGGGIAGVAGRCISVAGSLWDVTRVIPASAITGEAARLGASGAADVRQVLSHRGIPLHLKDCPRETQPIRRSK